MLEIMMMVANINNNKLLDIQLIDSKVSDNCSISVGADIHHKADDNNYTLTGYTAGVYVNIHFSW